MTHLNCLLDPGNKSASLKVCKSKWNDSLWLFFDISYVPLDSQCDLYMLYDIHDATYYLQSPFYPDIQKIFEKV